MWFFEFDIKFRDNNFLALSANYIASLVTVLYIYEVKWMITLN